MNICCYWCSNSNSIQHSLLGTPSMCHLISNSWSLVCWDIMKRIGLVGRIYLIILLSITIYIWLSSSMLMLCSLILLLILGIWLGSSRIMCFTIIIMHALLEGLMISSISTNMLNKYRLSNSLMCHRMIFICI